MQLIPNNCLRKISLISWLIILGSIFCLAGCTDGHHRKEVEQYIATIKARPPQPLPPLPAIKQYPAPKYEVAELRSPFLPNLVQETHTKRPKQPLEYFPLDSLHLVGIITRGQQTWGLITAPDGKLYKITQGQYLGQNDGRVIAVHNGHLDIVEMIADGNRQTEHHTKLLLWTGSASTTAAK